MISWVRTQQLLVVTSVLAMLVACDSDTKKKKHCSDLGQRLKAELEKDDKEVLELGGQLVQVSTAVWVHCAAADTCLAEIEVTSFSMANPASYSKTSLVVRDLMTNELVLGTTFAAGRLTTEERRAFSGKRDSTFPGCFRPAPL